MIEGLTSHDAFLRDTAAVYLLKHEPGMASKALDAIADQIVNPMDGGHLLWDLVKDVREASPGSLAPLANLLVERLSRTRKPDDRRNAILALGEIGPDARSAVPALLEESRSGDLAARDEGRRGPGQDRPAFRRDPAPVAAGLDDRGPRTPPSA